MGIRRSVGKSKKSKQPAAAAGVKREEALRQAARTRRRTKTQ
jgi:hypothetical protein